MFEIYGYFDGACKGNHQNTAFLRSMRVGICLQAIDETQVVIKDRRISKLITTGSGSAKPTNNRAELHALINLLDVLRSNKSKLKGVAVKIHGDSEYVVLGYNEGRKRKKNQDLWLVLDNLIEVLSKNGAKLSFKRIPRELNFVADELSSRSSDVDEVIGQPSEEEEIWANVEENFPERAPDTVSDEDGYNNRYDWPPR